MAEKVCLKHTSCGCDDSEDEITSDVLMLSSMTLQQAAINQQRMLVCTNNILVALALAMHSAAHMNSAHVSHEEDDRLIDEAIALVRQQRPVMARIAAESDAMREANESTRH